MTGYGDNTIKLPVTDSRRPLSPQVQATMDLVYKANVTDGLFHEHWLVKDGSPTGSTFLYFQIIISALT